MPYLNTNISVPAYASPLRVALGSYFSLSSSDQEFYQGLCEAIVVGFEEPWRILSSLQTSANPNEMDLQYSGGYRSIPLLMSSRRFDQNQNACFPLPDDLTGAAWLQDNITSPTVFLIDGIDVTSVEWGGTWWLCFAEDPFFTSDFAINSTLAADNTVADQSITVWMIGPRSDFYPLESTWGTIFNLGVRTEDQQDSLNDLIQSCSTGPSSFLLMAGAGRSYGHPVCEVDKEVVQLIGQDRRSQYVITDQSVYRFPFEAQFNVSVGEILRLGSPISSAIQWYDVSRGQVPPVAGWSVSNEQLGAGYVGDLIFPNSAETLIVDTTTSKTKVSVTLGGLQQDQDLFWADVHSRGVAGGRTLANFLDIRPNPVGEPTAADLPATLNPFALLVQETMTYHAVVGVLDFSQNLDSDGTRFLAAWRELMPSHQNLMIYSEFNGQDGDYPGPTGQAGLFGLAMIGTGGYYGLGTATAASGYPVVVQES